MLTKKSQDPDKAGDGILLHTIPEASGEYFKLCPASLEGGIFQAENLNQHPSEHRTLAVGPSLIDFGGLQQNNDMSLSAILVCEIVVAHIDETPKVWLN